MPFHPPFAERSRQAVLFAALALLAACASQPKKVATPSQLPPPPSQAGVKIGKPYVVFGKTYVPSDDRGYDQKGIASWYGPTFHAKATANGETYNQDDVTAAHKTLPMPSWVEVTNLDNGRQLVVRINDRGPFVDGRIIDLSRRSAQLLGVDRPGLANVRVKRVYPDGDWARKNPPQLVSSPLPPPPPTLPSTTLAAAPTIAPAPMVSAPTATHFIQVAALSDEGRARALASVLADFGPSAATPAPGGMWRVRIGPIDLARADTLLWDVRASGYPEARVVQ